MQDGWLSGSAYIMEVSEMSKATFLSSSFQATQQKHLMTYVYTASHYFIIDLRYKRHAEDAGGYMLQQIML